MDILRSSTVVGELHVNNLSIPTSEEQNSRTSPKHKLMSQITDQLSTFIVLWYSAECRPAANSKYQKCLISSCQRAEKDYQTVFRGTVQKLSVNDHVVTEEFKEIVARMFNDSVVNWGRVYVLFTLGGCVARHIAQSCGQLPESEKEQKLQMFSRCLAYCVKNYAGNWIVSQGGWEDMLAHRGDVDEHSGWGTALLTGGLIVGCAALYKVFRS